MQHFLNIICLLLLFSFFSERIIFANNQKIILTGSQKTGSYIFSKELSRLWESSKRNSTTKIVNKIEPSQKNRLEQISYNGVSLAIVDSKTAFEQLKKLPNLRVLSVLWRNWLYAIGSPQKTVLTFENTKNFLIHENSFYFSQFWRSISPKSRFKWFNKNSIPNFENGLSDEVVIFTGPKYMHAIFFWLEQFAGIHLVATDKKIIKSINLNYKWIIPKKIPANTYPYQSKSLLSITSHSVLVTNTSLADEFARDLLKIIFSQKGKINSHPLFKNLLIADNIIFRKVFPFHSSSKRVFRFK